MRPELQQIALGDNAFQLIVAHDRYRRLTRTKEGIGFVGQSVALQAWEGRALQVSYHHRSQRLSTGEVAQQQILSQAADHTPIFYYWRLADTIAAQQLNGVSYRVGGRDAHHHWHR